MVSNPVAYLVVNRNTKKEMPNRFQMHRSLAVLALLALMPVRGIFAQTPGPQTPSSTAEEQLTKTVGFITVPYKDGSATRFISGTCFFVFVPEERLGKEGGFVYIVTNRHVATAEGVDPKALLPGVFIRVNLASPQNGTAIAQNLVPFKGQTHWYFPSDDTIDLAVLPAAPKPGALDVKAIPIPFFATTDVMKSEQIGIGNSVFFVGFFLQFPGTTRVDPIYRQGVIAMMPADPIQMSDGRDQKITTLEHLYLADAHAFHGNSGSPLFVQISGFRNGVMRVGGFPYQLIGVVNGFIPERNDIQVSGAATFESSNEPNSGILMFVPAQELKDLLYSPELQKMRDDIVAAQHKP